jgi:hypothetical protein
MTKTTSSSVQATKADAFVEGLKLAQVTRLLPFGSRTRSHKSTPAATPKSLIKLGLDDCD